jgi:hypothetical protein
MTITHTHQPALDTPVPTDPPIRAQVRGSDLIHAGIPDIALRGLISDWEALCRRPSVLRRANAWGLSPEPLAHLDDIVRLAGFGKAVDDDAADHVLWRLTCLAATDQLAARLVLQRVLPPMISIAKRRGRITDGGFRAAFDEVLASAWVVITTFPVDRRTRKIAANLTRDIEYHAFVRDARLRRVDEVAVESDIIFSHSATSHVEPAEELAEILDDAERCGLAPEHLDVLRRLASGATSDEIGAAQGVSGRAIRGRRRKALDALREMSNMLI